MESVEDSFQSMKISEERKTFNFELLKIVGWKSCPTEFHLQPQLSFEDIESIIDKNGQLCLDVDVNELPRLKRITSDFTITPNSVKTPPEPKPNLLVIIMAILNAYKEKFDGKVEEVDLLNALSEYDVLTPRNPLISIVSKEPWTVRAVKYDEKWPVLINRERIYNLTPGRIGTLFEKVITVPSLYHRVYSVGHATFADSNDIKLHIGVMGEIDAVDSKGNLVEIKTMGRWMGKNTNFNRNTWTQSILGGVSIVVRGEFYQKKFQGAATFTRRHITYQTIDEFGRSIPGKNESLDFAGEVLRKIVGSVKKLGVVYEISGGGSDEISVTEATIMEPFVISKETVLNCIEVFCRK
ncbi:hypothetical protein HK098_003618 [Nowakowskiella sp. JEL0407]|nr:hypothetical protein HK098_003618 [Nowakowskiella sp. JEL0407]